MLKEIMQQEAIKRAAQQSLDATLQDEVDAIVAGIHAVFREQLDDLNELWLNGDYGRPVRLADQQPKWNGHVMTDGLVGAERCLLPFGVSVVLGNRISPRRAVLMVLPRVPETGKEAEVFLQLQRDYPYKSDGPSVFPGHTPPQELVRELLLMIVPEIHMEKL